MRWFRTMKSDMLAGMGNLISGRISWNFSASPHSLILCDPLGVSEMDLPSLGMVCSLSEKLVHKQWSAPEENVLEVETWCSKWTGTMKESLKGTQMTYCLTKNPFQTIPANGNSVEALSPPDRTMSLVLPLKFGWSASNWKWDEANRSWKSSDFASCW